MCAKSPPTVLHFTGSRWDGTGVHAVIRQLAQTGRYRSVLGVAPDFLAEKMPRLPVWRGPHVADDSIGPANLWPTLRVAWQVRRWLRRGAHRVFHGHSRAGLLVALWLWLSGERRCVVTVHVYGSNIWFYRLARHCLGRRLVWLTPAMKRHYRQAEDGWRHCLPNGLARRWVSEMHRWSGGKPLRVGGAGMLVRWKRWDLVLEALAQTSGVEFLHIGGAVELPDSRAFESELRARAARPDLAGRVRWLGWQADSSTLLGEVDVVVVPSDGEPFSMIAIEALFAGVPVVATRRGGPEDFIIEGRNGWLVPAGDAGALAARLTRCLDPSEWQSLRLDPEHLRRFSVPETLAECWAEIYNTF